jgi:outer membrane protein W
MPRFSRQQRFCATTISIPVALFALLLIGHPGSVLAEWYVGGYGGWSAPGSLKNVTMPNWGQTFAYQRYNFNPSFPNGDSLTQSFNTSDISLKNSPLYGVKAGYFFVDEGFSWLGVEVEAFTSTPSIKSQTLNTTQSITFIKGTPGTPPCFPPPVANCSMQEGINSQLPLTESSVRLITTAFNVVARYPGKVFQPYVGVGVGAFYFNSSGQIAGRQVVPGLNSQVGLKILATEEWGFFLEGKYNYAQISNLDTTYGLTGNYSAFSGVAGLAYHF